MERQSWKIETKEGWDYSNEIFTKMFFPDCEKLTNLVNEEGRAMVISNLFMIIMMAR